jgi:hypothetical protein
VRGDVFYQKESGGVLNYDETKRSRDRDYTTQYRDWVASLPPDERRALAAQGLLEPAVDAMRLSKGEDVTAMPLGEPAYGPNRDDATPTRADMAAGDGEAAWDALRRVIGELICEDNARLSLECLALVTGVAFDGSSMSTIAKRHGLTRAAVSKRCVALTDQLHLGRSRAMRSLTARTHYQTAQNQKNESSECFNHRNA